MATFTSGDNSTMEVTGLTGALQCRIKPDASPMEAEEWWRPALMIDASLVSNDRALAQENGVLRRLIWAVSAGIGNVKRASYPDLDAIHAALTGLARSIGWQAPETRLKASLPG